MNLPASLETLFDPDRGGAIPLPSDLARLYGRLQFPPHPGRPYNIANFVSSLDGIVSLGVKGHAGGDAISGADRQDAMVMGILRALADAIIIGAGNLRASPNHIWTAEHVFPGLAPQYEELRKNLGKPDPPLTVIATGRGSIDPSWPIFRSPAQPVLIAATAFAAEQIAKSGMPAHVRVFTPSANLYLGAREILDAVAAVRPTCNVILVEGGPHLLADFFAERCIDEIFLTLAPQLAGRNNTIPRLGLIEGKVFAPENPLWGKIVSIKKGEKSLFFRYAFEKIEHR